MESIKLLKTAIKQLQNGERTCIGCVVRQVEKEMKELDKAGFAMSAELSYNSMLIKEYESIIPEEKQKQIKDWIYSEDNR